MVSVAVADLVRRSSYYLLRYDVHRTTSSPKEGRCPSSRARHAQVDARAASSRPRAARDAASSPATSTSSPAATPHARDRCRPASPARRRRDVRVGVIGSGQIGATVAALAARAGHEVAVANSRGPESLARPRGRARALARATRSPARPRTASSSSSPTPSPPTTTLPADDAGRHGRRSTPATTTPTATARSPALDDDTHHVDRAARGHAPGAHVVKAFNTLYWEHLRDRGGPDAADAAPGGLPRGRRRRRERAGRGLIARPRLRAGRPAGSPTAGAASRWAGRSRACRSPRRRPRRCSPEPAPRAFARMARAVRRTELTECRAVLDVLRPRDPARDLRRRRAAPPSTQYDEPLSGRRYMGCLHKVFATEIDVEHVRGGRAHPRRLRRGQARGRAAAPLRVRGRAAHSTGAS